MTGLERNPVVQLACFAPLLTNINDPGAAYNNLIVANAAQCICLSFPSSWL